MEMFNSERPESELKATKKLHALNYSFGLPALIVRKGQGATGRLDLMSAIHRGECL